MENCIFWNISGIKHKTSEFFKEILSHKPTIFALTETWANTSFKLNYFSKYKIFEVPATKVHSKGRHKGGLIVGVLSEHVNYFTLVHSSYNNIIIRTSVNNNPVYLIFCYLSHPIQELETLISEEVCELGGDFIIFGDFNARTGCLNGANYSRQSKDKIVNQAGRNFIKFINRHDLQIINGTSLSDKNGDMTFINSSGSSVIDYCLVSTPLKCYIKDFIIINSLQSDHLPIKATFCQCSTQQVYPKTSVKRINYSKAVTTRFFNEVDEYNSSEPFLYQNLVNHIYDTAEKSGIVDTIPLEPKIHNPTFFNSECLVLKRKCLAALRNLRKVKSTDYINCESARLHYIEQRNIYRLKLKSSKLNYYKQIRADLLNSRNAQLFYKALNKFRSPNRFVGPDQVKIEKFYHFYKELFTYNSCNMVSELVIPIVEIKLLDNEFTLYELNTTLKKIPKSKAPGSDGIPNEIWKQLNNLKFDLLDCLNHVWRSEIMPESWGEIVVSPIFKKDDPSEPKNYRPISLANTVLKIFTSMMTNRLTAWRKQEKNECKFQGAYKAGSGCEDLVFVLKSIIQCQLDHKNGLLFALFVDLSQAFDSIIHSKLYLKLAKLGVSNKFIRLIMCLYTQATAKIRTKCSQSEKFKIGKGVLQGETLSPILFTIFIEDLIDHLEKSKIPGLLLGKIIVHVLMYADDIVLLASNAIYLQSKIDLLVNYFKENELKVNLGKTKVVIFRNRNKLRVIPNFFWAEDEIEVVDSYTYLGVPFHAHHNVSSPYNYFLHKANSAETSLFKLFYKSGLRTFKNRNKLFESMVRSVLFYCAPVWGLKHCNKFEIFQSNFFRRLLNVPPWSPSWALQLELNTNSILFFFVRSVLKFWYRILCKPNCSLVSQALIEIKSKRRKNWYSDFVQLLDNFEIKSIVNPDVQIIYSKQEFKFILKSCSQKVRDALLHKNILRMQASRRLKSYREIKSNIITEKYLNLNVPWSICRLLFQIRINLGQITAEGITIKLGELSNFYSEAYPVVCQLCNQQDAENIHHIMFVCPHYRFLRNWNSTGKTFNDLRKSSTQHALTEIYIFWKQALKLRNEYILESENC